jgi:hypothetical protein
MGYVAMTDEFNCKDLEVPKIIILLPLPEYR